MYIIACIIPLQHTILVSVVVVHLERVLNKQNNNPKINL